jgi:hypothetical protein
VDKCNSAVEEEKEREAMTSVLRAVKGKIFS